MCIITSARSSSETMYKSFGGNNAWLLGGKEMGKEVVQREMGAAWKKDFFIKYFSCFECHAKRLKLKNLEIKLNLCSRCIFKKEVRIEVWKWKQWV